MKDQMYYSQWRKNVQKLNPRHEITEEYENNKKNIPRRKGTIKFLRRWKDIISGKCLDVGDRTLLTEQIEKEFGIRCSNTTHDLDRYGNFDTFKIYDNIFIFGVLSHLLNPLQFLEEMRYVLKDSGSIWLSLPLNRPDILKNKTVHFHEYSDYDLEYLLKKSGLEIILQEEIKLVRLKDITGFRPLLRWLGFDKYVIMRITKKNNY